MTLNSSGAISLAGSTSGQSIALELSKGATSQITLNDTDVRTLGGKASGAIAMPTDFWGKSNAVDIGAVAFATFTSPYVQAFKWTTAGFGTQYSNPSTLPAGGRTAIEFSNSGGAVAAAGFNTPQLVAWPWSDSTGFGAKYTNPSSYPAGATCYDVKFNGTGSSQVVVATINQAPGVVAYKWSDSTGFGTKFSNPSSPPVPTSDGSYGAAIAFSKSGNAIVITTADYSSGTSSPYIHAYAWSSSSGFGTKYSNPSFTYSGDAVGQALSFSSTGGAVGMISAYELITIYEWSDSTGFGATYVVPSLHSGVFNSGLTFHPSSGVIAIGFDAGSESGIAMYQWSDSSGFGTRYADPSNTTGWGDGALEMTFSPSGTVFGAITDDSPYLAVYPWNTSTGFGTRYSNPAAFTGAGDLAFRGSF